MTTVVQVSGHPFFSSTQSSGHESAVGTSRALKSSFSSIRIKDPGSALTHFIGAVASVAAAPCMIQRFVEAGADTAVLCSICVFLFSLILLYSASTAYHTVVVSPAADKIFKKIDHMSIFVLIAGTYTPLCLTVMRDTCGTLLLIAIWSMAFAGIFFKFFWVTCPKWVSSVIYIGMGWMCVLAFPWLLPALSPAGFWLLLSGGIVYTVGGIIYALKLPIFNSLHPNFGSHEIFHLFVMGGSLLHFIMIYNCLLP